jgi:hypothetical protein
MTDRRSPRSGSQAAAARIVRRALTTGRSAREPTPASSPTRSCAPRRSRGRKRWSTDASFPRQAARDTSGTGGPSRPGSRSGHIGDRDRGMGSRATRRTPTARTSRPIGETITTASGETSTVVRSASSLRTGGSGAGRAGSAQVGITIEQDRDIAPPIWGSARCGSGVACEPPPSAAIRWPWPRDEH